MPCTYEKSDVFAIADSDNVTRASHLPAIKLVSVSDSDCHTAYSQITLLMQQDVLAAVAALSHGHDMPSFFLMCHANELTVADLFVSQYIEEHVQIRDIHSGVPITYNYYLYVTDPTALGLSGHITDADALGTQLRNAVKITYIRK